MELINLVAWPSHSGWFSSQLTINNPNQFIDMWPLLEPGAAQWRLAYLQSEREKETGEQKEDMKEMTCSGGTFPINHIMTSVWR